MAGGGVPHRNLASPEGRWKPTSKSPSALAGPGRKPPSGRVGPPMGRPENTISSSGAVADFAQQLRLLRQHAALTLRQLAGSTGLSTATLSVAASGQRLPTWEVLSAYVQACGGDTEEWRVGWGQGTRRSPGLPARRRAP